MTATQEVHGFCTREAWTKWFVDYNLAISNINDSNYELIQSELPADQWVEQYKHNSAMVRDVFCRNEEMLEWHIRWFTRTPGRWTRDVADPLLSMLFRYVTRVQDLGTAFELAESLLNYYSSLGDEIALMKCYTVRLFSCDFLDSIHLADDVYADCENGFSSPCSG